MMSSTPDSVQRLQLGLPLERKKESERDKGERRGEIRKERKIKKERENKQLSH